MKPNTEQLLNEIAANESKLAATKEFINTNESKLNDHQIASKFLGVRIGIIVIRPEIEGAGKGVARLFGGLDWEKTNMGEGYYWYEAETNEGVVIKITAAEEVTNESKVNIEL